MPTTIDQRDITLTENGRPTVRHAVKAISSYTTLGSGYSLETRASISTGNNPSGETSRHELRIIKAGAIKATFFWDTVAEWDGAAPATWSITEDAHTSTPAHTGGVTATRPSTAVEWTADFSVGSDWWFDAFVWSTTASGFTTTISPTLLTAGVQFALTVKEGSSTRFSGLLKITHTSEQVTVKRGQLRLAGAPTLAKSSRRAKAK